MDRMGRVVKDLVKHTQWANTTTVLQLIVRFGIKNLQARRFLSRSLRWESAAEDQTGEQYSKQGRIKELKHLNKTSWSPKILKDFLSRPIFWATEEEMERMCLSKVNLLSNIIPRILKNSHEFREVLPTKRSGWGRKYSLGPTNNHTLSFVRVQPHAPQITPCTTSGEAVPFLVMPLRIFQISW